MNLFNTILFLLVKFYVISQSAVEIAKAEIDLKANEEKTVLFGFAEGDELICDFKVNSRKNNIQFEISEYQSNAVFTDSGSKKGKKSIKILRTGIYQFKISNSNEEGKSFGVNYTIQRIPKDEKTQNFNSHVYWKEVYNTIHSKEKGIFVVGKDTSVVEIIEQTAKIHSSTNVMNGNDNEIKFSLPKNTETWSYYIGVGQEGADRYAEAVRGIAKSATPLLKLIPNYGPLAAVALNGASFLTVAQEGEDVNYCFIDLDKAKKNNDDSDKNCFKEGFVINDFGRITNKKEGNYKLILSNDNLVMGISVFVKITAIVVKDRIEYEKPVTVLIKKEIPYLKD